LDLNWKTLSVTKDTTPQDEGVWVITFDSDDGDEGDEQATVELPSPGIMLMENFPAIAQLETGNDNSDWTAMLKALTSNVNGLMKTDTWQQRQCKGSCDWWNGFLTSESARTTKERPCDLRPEDYFPRLDVRTGIPPSDQAPAPPRQARREDPAVDTVLYSGFTRADRDHALRDKKVLDERSSSSYKTLRAGVWCMVRFEIGETARALMEADGDDDEEEDIRLDVGDEEFDAARVKNSRDLVAIAPRCVSPDFRASCPATRTTRRRRSK